MNTGCPNRVESNARFRHLARKPPNQVGGAGVSAPAAGAASGVTFATLYDETGVGNFII